MAGRLVVSAVAGLLLQACAGGASPGEGSAALSSAAALSADGLRIAERECGACHAVRATGESPYPGAPPLRRLSGRVSLAALETDFAEGISMGHPDMPQFQFDLDGVDALLAYLRSIQEEDPGEP